MPDNLARMRRDATLLQKALHGREPVLAQFVARGPGRPLVSVRQRNLAAKYLVTQQELASHRTAGRQCARLLHLKAYVMPAGTADGGVAQLGGWCVCDAVDAVPHRVARVRANVVTARRRCIVEDGGRAIFAGEGEVAARTHGDRLEAGPVARGQLSVALASLAHRAQLARETDHDIQFDVQSKQLKSHGARGGACTVDQDGRTILLRRWVVRTGRKM